MKKFRYNLITLLILLLLIWVIPAVGVYMVNKGYNFDKLGPYGDFIAGTTVPLLTFISFLALVITLKLQKEQLEVQSKELRNSIEEMQATRKEFEVQNKTLAVQRFENTFFHMVSLHNEIVDSIQIGEKRGRTVFTRIYGSLINEFSSTYAAPENKGKNEIEIVKIAYQKLFESNEHLLGHYFRNLYRIVKFIDENQLLSFEDKKSYIGIIRAQLSTYELLLLFYNSLSFEGHKFLMLIGKYNLIDNMNSTILIKEDHHLSLFRDEYDFYNKSH